jgi:diguanylate cyclase (GGDEF)-like protein
MRAITHLFSNWTILQYGDSEIDDYAKGLLAEETRQGLFSLSLILVFLLGSAALLSLILNMGSFYLLTYTPLAALCLHILLSSYRVDSIEAQQLLAIVLLVVCSTAFVLLAHKTGKFSLPVLAGIALLFTVVPLMPWGLREASAACSLIYLVFTLSTLSVRGRFDYEILLLLQFFMISAALISLTVVSRNSSVRRKEIISMYNLENAHAKMAKLSYQDPLTGAWNRRYLTENFRSQVAKYQRGGKHFSFILVDFNNFKLLNDTYGHDYGDMVLRHFCQAIMENLAPDDVLVRMGGDEFALMIAAEPRKRLADGIGLFKKRLQGETATGVNEVTVTCGLLSVSPEPDPVFKDIYQAADKAMYQGKEVKKNQIIEVDKTTSGSYIIVDLDAETTGTEK